MGYKCAWPAYRMLSWTFIHLNRSVQLLPDLHHLLASLKHHYLQTCPPPPHIFLSILFHHWNLSEINVIPNPPCLHSTSCLLQSGQFLFYQSRHQWLRSCLFGYIRIGNLILCQSFLSFSHRQTFHICIQTEEGWLHLSRDAWTGTGEHTVAQSCSFLQPFTRDPVY